MKYLLFTTLLSLTLISCQLTKGSCNHSKSQLKSQLEVYVPVDINPSLKGLTKRDKKVITHLIEAGKVIDELFWNQTSSDAIALREKHAKKSCAKGKIKRELLNIYYGPYDMIFEQRRFVGDGPKMMPAQANLYPQDMTKEEFEKYVKKNPAKKKALESLYTMVRRDKEGKLEAIPYHKFFASEIKLIVKHLREAAKYADDKRVRRYLKARATAMERDDYYKSDMLWMDMKNTKIEFVIGPIENYLDHMFGYKTAYEAGIFIKDARATRKLDMFYGLLDYFEHHLPYEKKYIRKSVGKGNVLRIVNVLYFGGDFNQGVKTIATSLPNDPKVHKAKGAKKIMFKNMIEAKFDKIVVPIAKVILAPTLLEYVDRASFMSFVTLHEVSHTLGRGYVYGQPKLKVRKAIKEHYSAIEETKADIVSMYNHYHLVKRGKLSKKGLKKAMVTYLAGLYRSIRFGSKEAHGKANLIQLNFLKEHGGIFLKDGLLNINDEKFGMGVKELARLVLTIEAKGDYQMASDTVKKYGVMDSETDGLIERLSTVPRDITLNFKGI